METERMVVLYDGFCNLCSRSVQWIIRNDPRRRFSFAPLQAADSKIFTSGRIPLDEESEEPAARGVPLDEESVILVLNDRVYLRSAAALRIAIRLRFPWPLLGIFFIVPRFLRDPVYRIIARNRKRWFGERDQCYIP